MPPPRPVFKTCLFALGLVFAVALADDWPQWRGPEHNGHVAPGTPVPVQMPAEPKVVWRLKVGEGLASPVVAQGKVIYFDAVEGKETLHVIDATTTNELWRATVDDTFKDGQGPAGPRCTPMVDGSRVYAQSCKGELQCRQLADGKLLWRVNYTNDLGAIFIGEKQNTPGAARHGNNGMAVVEGRHLITCPGGTNGAGVACFDKETGKLVWKSQNDQAAYAPPVIATLAGVRQVICFAVDGVLSVAVDDGRLLWRVPIKTAYARHVTTPVIFEDYVVVSSHQAGMFGIKVIPDGHGLKAETAWTSKEAAMNFASPVAIGRHLYGLGPAKNVICVDIPSGKVRWSKDGYFTTSADKAHAGFIVMRQNILMLTDGGQVVLFAGKAEEFQELGRTQVCGMNWCNPAYAEGKLYVRDGIKTTGELACVQLLP